jgi:peptidoglycan hydrolase-like protein with peptidoglycan-binding domain
MSVSKVATILFSSFLMFATAPVATSKDTGKTTTAPITKGKVRQAQAALKKAGFDPGPIDGVMGAKTMAAVRKFQTDKGLEVTGIINAETENALLGNPKEGS